MNLFGELSAEELYREWFKRHPDIPNPSDVNTEEKFNYMVEIGWAGLARMQHARKQNTIANGKPNPFIFAKYWEGE